MGFESEDYLPKNKLMKKFYKAILVNTYILHTHLHIYTSHTRHSPKKFFATFIHSSYLKSEKPDEVFKFIAVFPAPNLLTRMYNYCLGLVLFRSLILPLSDILKWMIAFP